MRRRTFLGLAGGAGAATIVGPYVMRRAHAQFGAFPAGTESVMLPDGVRAKRVLEVFLYGGLSPWETLYFVRGYGQDDDQQYYAYESANAQWAGACNAADPAETRTFGTDALGVDVELGPFAHRLWQRKDVLDRMRLVVQKHALEPHEAAVPQALTGRPVGQPNAAGLGAHVQRARIDAADSDRASPHSYVFATGGVSSDNVAAAATTGSHPGAARPLLIKTDNAAKLTGLLDRPTLGAGRHHHDSLVAAYSAQYQARLHWPARAQRVRSANTDDFDIAFNTTRRVDAIKGVLSADLLADRSDGVCNVSPRRDIPLMGLTAGARLLTHATEPASYVCVSDIGLREASGGGGYDTHSENAEDTAVNFDNMLKSLLGVIRAPGDTAADKISLDDTLIILNTEFGRTPGRQGQSGRNHHPYGYVTAFIGGPTQNGIAGAIGPDGNAATDGGAPLWATPAQNRIAALLALGIWPFSHEGFAVSDVPGAVNELDAAKRAIAMCLGRTV